MGHMYTAVFEGVTVSAAQDLFSLQPASNKVVVLHEVHVTQDDSETSQQLPVRIKRLPATFTVGSGGAAVTPRPMVNSAPAAGATVRRNDTTPATTSGTSQTLRRAGENVLTGWHWIFTPETRPVFVNGEGLVVDLPTAPAAGIPMSGELVFEEIG